MMVSTLALCPHPAHGHLSQVMCVERHIWGIKWSLGKDGTTKSYQDSQSREVNLLAYAAKAMHTCKVTFFPEAATSHTKNVTKRVFGYPESWGAKRAVKPPSDLFKVSCPHSTDSELCGHTRHVNQFQHVISQLYPKIGPLISRCFLKVNKIGLSDSIFVEYRKTL